MNPATPTPNRSAAVAPATVAVVVIARNEEKHIEQALGAAIGLRATYPDCPIVLVDSASQDATVRLASKYPISIYRYDGAVRSPAAGRRIGFARVQARFVMFVDGDCQVEADWVVRAIERLEANPRLAVAFGSRHTIYDPPGPPSQDDAAAREPPGLGGNALYRAEALERAGGFNPYLRAEEEAELLGRLRALGYEASADNALMITHHTELPGTLNELRIRLAKGFVRGPGQVLRVSLGNGLFLHHARRFGRTLATFFYLAAGLLMLAYAGFSGKFLPLGLWAAMGAVAFLWLCLRRGSVRDATVISFGWIATAAALPGAFLQPVPRAADFDPSVELIR